MKSLNEIKHNIANLNEMDQRKARQLAKSFESFTTKKAISREGLKELYNIQTELHMFTEQYSDRLINLLRQHHMID
tara:strand:- start:126 stop:353 length:228 start_codon:yes stop_codon:yes gene_type:complete